MGHGISTKESMAESSQTAENGPVSGGLVCCFGEMLIDFVPTESGVSLAKAPAFVKAAGGAPANVAIAVVRLGGNSAFVGKLGDDEFGYFLKGVLEQNGVNADGVVFDTEARTALAFVTLRKDGEREFMFYRHPSADMRLRDEELNLSVLRKAKVLHYGSISLISEPCRAAHLHAMKEAKAAGAILSFDPNLRLPLWPSEEAAREMIMSIWKDADIIKISENEQEFLTKDGSLNDEVSFSLMHEKLKLLIVTVGDQGCKYFTHKFHGMVGTVKVHAVDTTGAGDAFVGALLKQISEDASVLEDEERLRKVLKFANVCGAITTTKRGAIPSLPREEEVLQLLHENN